MRDEKRLGRVLIITLILTTLTMLSIGMSAVAQDEIDDVEEGLLPGLFCLTGILCIIPIVILILWIVMAVWVYKDAERRGKSGILWFIIVFFTGIIGLIIWLVVRPPEMAGPLGYPPQQPYYPPPQQPGYPPQQPGYPPQQPGYPPQ